MASREKRPLAPSKSKQKATESSISSPDIKAKKGKALPNLRQQIARDILEAVATGSQLPPKLEASLPRKKALEKLKRNQKLRTKSTLIKAKQKVPIKTARRINTDVKKTVKPRKGKQLVNADAKVSEAGIKGAENSTDNADNEGKGTESGAKSAKVVAKTVKKTKATASKTADDSETKESQDKETSGVASKVSPKAVKKQSDSPKTGKAVKAVIPKKATNKVSVNKSSTPGGVLLFWESKGTKSKKNLAKDADDNSVLKTAGAVDNKEKNFSEDKNSIDLTIDEVIASMLSDPELDEAEEKEEIKGTKGKKMLVGERSFCDIEIKKEIDCDNVTGVREESPGIEQITQLPNSVQIRRKISTPSQRSLRNGKLRQLSDSGISMDLELKKRGRLNSDDHSVVEQYVENTSDGNIDTESCFSESSVNDSRINVVSSKDDLSSIKDNKLNHIDEVIQLVSEIENNNNGEQMDIVEVGPTLRSKKTRTSDDNKVEEVKVDESKSGVKIVGDDSKKSANLDILKKDKMFTKIIEKPKSRRNSLNTDVKKINPFAFSSEKSDGSSKSHIDQMIESIKLTIAKSIERKIYSQEKGKVFEGLSKSFEVPKIEEIVAPLSTETQKVGLEERAEKEKPIITENEVISESSDNSVPKVADTAKEIEKLVMGDIKLVDSQSQKKEIQVDSSDAIVPVVNDQNTEDTTHQRTIADEKVNSVSDSQVTQCENPVSKTPLSGTSNLEENLDSDNLKKPGRSKTEDSTTEKADCLNIEETEDIEPEALSLSTKPIQKNDSFVAELMDTSNLTVDSDTSIVLNLSSLSEDEHLDCISMDVVPETVNLEDKGPKVDDKLEVVSSEIEITSQKNKLNFKDVPCLPDKSETNSVSLMTNEEIIPEEEHKNNHLLIDGCDNVTATCAQTQLTHSSSETDKEQAQSSNRSLIDTDKEMSEIVETVNKEDKSPILEKVDKSEILKCSKEEEQTVVEETKRVLRGREKQKKADSKPASQSSETVDVKMSKEEEKGEPSVETQSNGSILSEEKVEATQSLNKAQNISKEEGISPEAPVRTRRARETKKPVTNSNLKPKRNRKDVKKSEQQNKEETLLDNEVATINENKLDDKYRKPLEGNQTLRGCSVPSTNKEENQTNKIENNSTSNRSKSENDLESMQNSQRSHSNGGSYIPKDSNNEGSALDDEKATKTPDNLQKDSDEASSSGESLSSIIQETPEEKARKETVFRLLGLESWEKAAERLSQKAKREQTSGTLKMRIQKGREKDKMRSRSPLKMVLKQGDSFEVYTIQKEFGPGVGESSSGANRKLTTNHRHSCDEDNEEAQPKDRQSLVIPEKSSSFSIHPGRCCGDVCCYCFGKFGSLDTPMHLAQMKSNERRQKILNLERHLTKDSCLCDACYRHIDRKANQSPTNIQTKPQKQHRQLLVPKCCARGCGVPARNHVRRRWLQKVKVGLKSEVDINWESNQLTSMSFCVTHYSKVAKFLNCGLCKRRLQKNQSFSLSPHEAVEFNQRFKSDGMEITTTVGIFICKLCRCFISLHLKYKNENNMHKTNKEFCKKYKNKILINLSGGMDTEMDDISPSQGSKDKDKEKRKKVKTKSSTLNSKLPEVTNNSSNLSNPSLEKLVSKPDEASASPITVTERIEKEPKTDNKPSTDTSSSNESSLRNDLQFIGIEKTIEKLKKRKALEALGYPNTNTNTNTNANTSTNTSESSEGANVVEILAMDKEVTLTRLPKKPRTNNDITPVVQRLGANPSISVRTLFPGEEEMNLHANIEFGNVREVTPQGWEKCATMIQYDRDTKVLWQELQRPYGNQSSFLRHLILLEKYYRSGDLVLAPNASRNAINYSTSVHNRLISYEGPEKVDEPIMEPMSIEFSNTRRLSGGYVVERDRVPPTNTTSFLTTSTPNMPGTSQASKINPQRVMKLNPGVSIMKKPPPNLQRLSFPSTSGSSILTPKRKDSQKPPMPSGGKVFQMSEPEFKRLQNLKRQKQMMGDKNSRNSSNGPGAPGLPPGLKSVFQVQKAQSLAQSQFQKHLRMQQEMLNRQSRSDFEPLVCDMRTLSNENTPTQNFLGNFNLPKSIQVTTKPSNPISILPKIPKSLTVIPQTVPRSVEKMRIQE